MHYAAYPLSDEIHIWSASLKENRTSISYFTSILSEDEFQKSKNFISIKEKNSFITSRGILRCLLGMYLKIDPKQVEILYGFWGKPYLSPNCSLYFNLSHSRDYVLYAFTSTYEVGIDIEYMDLSLDTEELALVAFSSQEQAYWAKVDPKHKTSCFFKFWVYKEAFLKAIGKGWLHEQHELPLTILDSIYKDHHSQLAYENAVYFNLIPNYASAFYIKGPYLCPLYYTWKLS